METFLILARETLEASLLVGILATTLKRLGRTSDMKRVWWGTGLAVAACLVLGLLANRLESFLSGSLKTWLDISIFFLAAVFLSFMVLWMTQNAPAMKGRIQGKALTALESGHGEVLFLLAFMGVFREGLETILFLWGIALQGDSGSTLATPLLEGMAGVVTGILVVFALFKGFSRIPLTLFFRLTSVLLILMAAGMIASGVGRLISIGVLSPLIFQVWDTSRLLNEHSMIGTLFSDFFGYRARPSLMTLITVWGYLAVMFTGLWRISQIRTAPSPGTLPEKTARPTGHTERP
ncbi:FTR1 family iron permease [Leptospirillum ferriphilum]|uniref:High-affinity Fe2+/Pb2+ permease n=1 Tax=Leptospirillum ferriphilum YSK TaxID=1441628 RepID=A0A059XP40_9BACT|nr:FTR1 family protein [Leptospirillum ferriphilum]AIA30299.1 high-affinity Fe2+/Pb2+ permease [Leptospirillum ferriphilum YSK]